MLRRIALTIMAVLWASVADAHPAHRGRPADIQSMFPVKTNGFGAEFSRPLFFGFLLLFQGLRRWTIQVQPDFFFIFAHAQPHQFIQPFCQRECDRK